MSFFAELKRRNVVRVGIAYLIGGWLLLQIADVVLNNIAAPDWVFKAIMLLVGIGLPIALFFAWAFEMTPEGVKRESEIDRSQSITSTTGRKLDRTIIMVLVIPLGYFIWQSQTPDTTVEPMQAETPITETRAVETLAQEPSIAILPFVNMSADPEQEFFSDGISEEILNVLVRVKGLKVASRTSSFTYKGKDLNIPEIARQLKVGNILEGSVRKSGNRVRITAQLINANDDRHLWSDTFDRELTDIFAIQDEIARAIVNALKQELNVGLEAVKVETVTQNLDAYELYLKARGLFTARQSLDIANQLFQRAVELDPDFTQAWEGLAASQQVSNEWLLNDGIDHQQLAIQAAEKAIALDASLSMPYAVLSLANARQSPPDFIAARKNLDMAIANDPNNTTAWLWSGLFYKALGFPDKAISDLNRCLKIDPAYLNCEQHLAQAYLIKGDQERAMQHLVKTVEANFHSIDWAFIPLLTRSGDHLLALYMADSMTDSTYAPVIDYITALENPDANHSAQLLRLKRWAEKNNQDMMMFPHILLALKAYDHFADTGIPGTSTTLPAIWQVEGTEFRQTEYFKQMVRNNSILLYWQSAGFPDQCRALGEEDFECE